MILIKKKKKKKERRRRRRKEEEEEEEEEREERIDISQGKKEGKRELIMKRGGKVAALGRGDEGEDKVSPSSLGDSRTEAVENPH
jgi:hypothetical protein